MSDLFSPYTTPSPRRQLKARVLTAASSDRPTRAWLRTLDSLGSSRIWWLAWGGSMIVLVALAGGPRAGGERLELTAESWRRYRASVAAALTESEPAAVPPEGSISRGAA